MKHNQNRLLAFQSAIKKEQFLPVLLVSICRFIALLLQITDRFIYPISRELLSPMISQIVVILIPLYLCMTVALPERSPVYMLHAVGCRKLRADNVFLIIFTSLFMITTSLLLNLVFGGVYSASEGFTLLGSFTAGAGEYTSTYPYLMIVYAAAPTFIEEILLRGFIYSRFSRVSEATAIAVSTVISSLFAFSIAGLPAAIFCSLAYCFIRYVTGTLWSCMIVHFVFNFYAQFLQTNVAKYFLSAQNRLVLIVIVVAAWLIASALFFSERARVFKARADKIKSGEEVSALPEFGFKTLGRDLKQTFSHRPTMICSIISGGFSRQ